MTNPTVPYVTGRRKALARALALEAARLQGTPWKALTKAEQNQLIREANRVIGMWIGNGVLAEFPYEWRG